MKTVLEKTLYSVYAISCKENNKVYIGVSRNPSARIEQHFSELRKGLKTETANRFHQNHARDLSNWQKDFDKYGEDSFEVYILETNIAYLRAFEKEAFYIAMYDSANPSFGYNLYSERNKLKIPIKSKPPVPSIELFRKHSDLDSLAVELKTLVDSASENYSNEDDYVTALLMHLQRISVEFSELTDSLFK